MNLLKADVLSVLRTAVVKLSGYLFRTPHLPFENLNVVLKPWKIILC